MAKRKPYIPPTPREVYRSPEGRVVVYRYESNDFLVEFDGEVDRCFSFEAEAMHRAAMLLEDEMRRAA